MKPERGREWLNPTFAVKAGADHFKKQMMKQGYECTDVIQDTNGYWHFEATRRTNYDR